MSQVLLVSTDDWLRGALEVCLSEHLGAGHEVIARSTATADEVAAGEFDAIVVDAGQDQAAITSWCARVAEQSTGPVLVLHDDADVDLLTGCLEAGAAGFQTKAIGVAELMTALDAVRRGEAVVPRRMLGGLLGSLIQRKRRDDDAADRYEALTRREREILAMIAHGDDRNAIAAQLVISPQTARTHIQNVLTKLGVHSRIDAARFAHQHGYADTGGRS
jgi:DNA-binding NarL/FixJ family response regulator